MLTCSGRDFTQFSRSCNHHTSEAHLAIAGVDESACSHAEDVLLPIVDVRIPLTSVSAATTHTTTNIVIDALIVVPVVGKEVARRLVEDILRPPVDARTQPASASAATTTTTANNVEVQPSDAPMAVDTGSALTQSEDVAMRPVQARFSPTSASSASTSTTINAVGDDPS